MTFDATVAWPAYDWMGVAKAGAGVHARATSPATSARDGIRCNLVSAGPLKTLAAKAIPGFEDLESMWSDRAPLGWDETDHAPTARAVVRAAVRLLPGHDRRDHPRRRRLPRDGCLTERDPSLVPREQR